MERTYVVYTDYDPQQLTKASLYIFELWVKFALGKEALGGKILEHPTGRYASSIKRVNHGPTRVAIIADEKKAPEGAFLEEGHDEIDLKQQLIGGRAYPMHRGKAGAYGSAGYGTPVLSTGKGAQRKNIWAKVRSQGFSGVARVPTKITPQNEDSWVIPAMPAYSPAGHLVELLKMANKR